MMGGTRNEMRLQRWLADRAFRYLFLAGLLGAAVLIGLVYSVNWKFGVALFGFVTLLVADLYSLRLAILPVFFAIPLDRLGKLGPEALLTWAKVLIAVLILAWAVHALVKRSPRLLDVLFHSPLFLLATLSLALSFLSVINARDYDIFLSQNLRRVNNFVLFILITTIIDSQKALRHALLVFLFAYFLVGLTVMYELASDKPILETVWGQEVTAPEYTMQTEEARVSGPSGDPDFLALSVILPFLVGVSLMFEPISRLTRVLVLPVILMMLIALLATGSRGALLALMLAAGVFWLLTKMRYKYLIAGVAIILVVGIVILLSVAGTSSAERYSGSSGGKSLVYRLGWTKMAFLMIEDHPWLGIGTGNFPLQYNRYSRTIPMVPRSPHWTHNSFLQTWAENGVFAFMVYAGLYLTAAGAMVKVIWTTTDPALRRLAVLMLSAVCAYFFFAGTSNVLENENYWIVFSIVTVTSALAREQSRGRPPARPLPEASARRPAGSAHRGLP